MSYLTDIVKQLRGNLCKYTDYFTITFPIQEINNITDTLFSIILQGDTAFINSGVNNLEPNDFFIFKGVQEKYFIIDIERIDDKTYLVFDFNTDVSENDTVVNVDGFQNETTNTSYEILDLIEDYCNLIMKIEVKDFPPTAILFTGEECIYKDSFINNEVFVINEVFTELNRFTSNLLYDKVFFGGTINISRVAGLFNDIEDHFNYDNRKNIKNTIYITLGSPHIINKNSSEEIESIDFLTKRIYNIKLYTCVLINNLSEHTNYEVVQDVYDEVLFGLNECLHGFPVNILPIGNTPSIINFENLNNDPIIKLGKFFIQEFNYKFYKYTTLEEMGYKIDKGKKLSINTNIEVVN